MTIQDTIKRLTRERDEARAEVAAGNFNPEELTTHLTNQWFWDDDDSDVHIVQARWRNKRNGAIVEFVVGFGWSYLLPNMTRRAAQSPLAAMRAADLAEQYQ